MVPPIGMDGLQMAKLWPIVQREMAIMTFTPFPLPEGGNQIDFRSRPG